MIALNTNQIQPVNIKKIMRTQFRGLKVKKCDFRNDYGQFIAFPMFVWIRIKRIKAVGPILHNV